MTNPPTDAIEKLIEKARTYETEPHYQLVTAARDQLERLKELNVQCCHAEVAALRARLSALEAAAEASRLALRAARNQIGCNCHVEPVGFMCSFCSNAIDFIDAALARDQKEQ